MAEVATKPGTANVSPADRKKLAPLLKHYGSMAHPFTACYRDQIKHGLSPDHAARRCAVLKDLIRGTTKWRKGRKGTNLALDELREIVDMADASGADCDTVREARRILDMASGLIPAEVTVRNAKGTTFKRKIMVRPSQAKAMKAQKGGAKVSQRGLKVTKEQTAVLNELAKIPKEQRPKGWQDAVRTLADPRHGGRLGPEKRRTLHALAQASPTGSPLRAAIAKALQADAAKPSERKKGKRVVTRKPRKIVPVGKGARA